MTRIPTSSTKRIAPARAAKKLSKPAKKLNKAGKKKPPRKPPPKPRNLVPSEIRPIEVDQTAIDYDATLAKNRGYLKVSPGAPPLEDPHGDTLLHLLFFLIYTKEGSELLKANGPDSAATPEQAKANLKAKLLDRFPTIEDGRPNSVLEPVIDAHFAADGYVKALADEDGDEQAEYQELYEQKLLAILGDLHDDAMAHEFSMLW